RAGVGDQLDLQPRGALPLAGDGVVGGDVLADAVVPDLGVGAVGGEGPEVGQEGLAATADVGLQHRVDTGDEAVALVPAGPRRPGGDVVGVVADLVVQVVLPQLGPQPLQ